MPFAERTLTPKDRFREVAALLARGLLRLKTYPPDASKKSSESRGIRLDVRRGTSPHVADG